MFRLLYTFLMFHYIYAAPIFNPTLLLPPLYDLYDYCNVKKPDGTPSYRQCVNNELYKNVCKWSDHYIKCLPKTHKINDMDIYCDVKDNINKESSFWKCKHVYNTHCKWNDHYLKCVPNTSEDPIDIFCDVRVHGNKKWPSKWKCISNPYNKKCYWNLEINKCLPLVATKYPTKSKGMG